MLRFICDICGAAASAVFCHTDSTYLCSSCDDSIHAEANPMACHHFRVPIQTTAYPSSSLLFQEFSALNHCQAEMIAAASEEFYYGSDIGECFEELITHTSTYNDDVLQTSCGSHQAILKDCDDMNVPIVHSLQLDQSLKSNQLWTKQQNDTKIQEDNVCKPPNCQTVPKSVSYTMPEITLSFSTQSGQHLKANRVECLAHPSAENSISREERVQRYKEKRKAIQMRKKIIFPSKKAYAASNRPRINGKFARRPMEKNVESN